MEAEGSSIKRDRGYREGHGLQTIRRIRRWLWGATLLILGMAALSTCDKFDFFGELEAASQVTETGALSLNPELSIVSLNNDVNLDASGGVSPYSYDIFTGSGSVNSATGVYTAPGAASNDVVRVTDSEGTTDLSVIRVLSSLNITPGSMSLVEGGPVKIFTGSGGEDTQPYTFTIVSGPGTITPAGLNAANYDPVAAGNAVIQVEDALGSVKEANVTVTPPDALRIDPIKETVTVGGTVNFTAFGGDGSPPHNFFKDSGSGDLWPLGPSTAKYDAPGSAEAAVIRVTDNAVPPNEVTATVFVVTVGPVSISPSSVTIKEGESFTFTASEGLAPYTFDMKSGNGTVDPVTGFYTAVKKGKDKVRVTDSLGDDDSATVNVKKN